MAETTIWVCPSCRCIRAGTLTARQIADGARIGVGTEPCAVCRAREDGDRIEALCEVMHDAYEAAAVQAGWETQERSREPWADVPEANKATMRAAVRAMLRSDILPGAVRHAALRDAWSAVNALRFAKRNGTTGGPDSFYNGVVHSRLAVDALREPGTPTLGSGR